MGSNTQRKSLNTQNTKILPTLNFYPHVCPVVSSDSTNKKIKLFKEIDKIYLIIYLKKINYKIALKFPYFNLNYLVRR